MNGKIIILGLLFLNATIGYWQVSQNNGISLAHKDSNKDPENQKTYSASSAYFIVKSLTQDLNNDFPSMASRYQATMGKNYTGGSHFRPSSAMTYMYLYPNESTRRVKQIWPQMDSFCSYIGIFIVHKIQIRYSSKI
jgi:hypothetical protein